MDYENARRVKVWGRARVAENDPELIERLMPEKYRARPEQALLISVEAWDINCAQHIPRKIDAGPVQATFPRLEAQIVALAAAQS